MEIYITTSERCGEQSERKRTRSAAFNWRVADAIGDIGGLCRLHKREPRAETGRGVSGVCRRPGLPMRRLAGARWTPAASGGNGTAGAPAPLRARYSGLAHARRTPAPSHADRPNPSCPPRASLQPRDGTALSAMRRLRSLWSSPPCWPCPPRRRRRRSQPLSATSIRPWITPPASPCTLRASKRATASTATRYRLAWNKRLLRQAKLGEGESHVDG